MGPTFRLSGTVYPSCTAFLFPAVVAHSRDHPVASTTVLAAKIATEDTAAATMIVDRDVVVPRAMTRTASPRKTSTAVGPQGTRERQWHSEIGQRAGVRGIAGRQWRRERILYHYLGLGLLLFFILMFNSFPAMHFCVI